MNKKAFTLAEVMITLGIIGIVAALTLPSLMAGYKRHRAIVEFKSAYSVLAQAVEQSKADNGDVENWDWTLNTAGFVDKYFMPYLKISRNCGTIQKTCWKPDNMARYANGTVWESFSDSNHYTAILSNGRFLEFHKQDNKHIHIFIGIGSTKQPKKEGINQLLFTLMNSQFNEPGLFVDTKEGLLHTYGHGLPESTLANNCKKGASGTYCGALYILNGWNIPSSVNYSF
ncbi:MAG: type II secretion system protein [Heliobacteriaceae bacterium]|jgi:prepilin-type N-terminal cleavage/methylation domain-containing protein|nr:type II secretion system protein [Heliobacteriaceae bacterium]